MFAGKGGVESLPHQHDVLALAYRPDGKQLAVATLNGDITLWDPVDAIMQVRSAVPLLRVCVWGGGAEGICMWLDASAGPDPSYRER